MDTNERTTGLLRDGLLALCAIAGLVDGLDRRGRLESLRSPGAALLGVLGAVGLEVVLLRHPERTRRVWERPGVQVAGLAGTVIGGRTLARRSGPWVAASLCWGLLAYLLLLGYVLAGRENPVSRLVESDERPSQS